MGTSPSDNKGSSGHLLWIIKVPKVKILDYLPLPILDDMTQDCATKKQHEPACRPRKEQQCKAKEKTGEKTFCNWTHEFPE